MSKGEWYRKQQARPLKLRLQKSAPMSGRDILRFEEHFKIAPKHPGMGRR